MNTAAPRIHVSEASRRLAEATARLISFVEDYIASAVAR